jgi:hypothetical protein
MSHIRTKYSGYSHIVYLTTNTVNGKQYVGDHTTMNLKDNYLGSGQALEQAIRKYGRGAFKFRILGYYTY